MSDTTWCSVLQQAYLTPTAEGRSHYIEPKRFRGTPPVPQHKVDRARELEAKGMSRNDVAKELKVSRASLWRRLGAKTSWNRSPKK